MILMKREQRATRSLVLPVRIGPLTQKTKRAVPLAVSHLLPRQPGQRPPGLLRQSLGLLPLNLPHPHLTEAPPGIGDPLETIQIVGAHPVSHQHLKMRMKLGGSVESSHHQRSL